MAENKEVGLSPGFKKIGGVGKGRFKKSGADLSDYTPDHIDAHSSLSAEWNVQVEEGSPRVKAWNDGNEFLGGKENKG